MHKTLWITIRSLRQLIRHYAILSAALLFALLVLQGCVVQPAIPALPEGAPADFPLSRYAQPAEGDRVLQIRDGTLTVKVYRGGRLARLGHNHVITSNGLTGLLQARANEPTNSFADLYLPLATLVVDEPAARGAAGADFSSTPSDKDRQGTLANLLGPRLFDAAEYPYVRAAIAMTSPSEALVQLTVRDYTSEHRIPVRSVINGSGIEITADWSTTHGALGLQPFSALGGAIVVKDPIELSLRLQALPAQATD